jgi:cobalt-zinc-cadmium efflux system protein
MEFIHSHSTDTNPGRAFKTGIIINMVFIIIEASFGFLSNSMALLADAGHNLSDVLALALSWIAVLLSQRKPTLKFTYGFRRSTIISALLNSILLLIAVSFIIYETIHRFYYPTKINADNVIIVATIGIGINAFTAWLFMRDSKHDLNIRSAFIHFVADALVSFGVVVAGIIIVFTGAQWVDSLVSFAIIIVILYSSYHLLIDSINLALDAVPENVNIEEVRNFFEEQPEVAGVHDLHIWALDTTDAALTVHLITYEQTDVNFIISIQNQLQKLFGIDHATIQVEFGNKEDCGIID